MQKGLNMNLCKSGNFPVKNKFWELQITTLWEGPYFNFHFEWSKKCDHAGLQILIEIHKFMFDFKIYDSRHWDWDNNTYVSD